MGMKLCWAVLAVLYVAFFSWYTSCAGPLSEQEIDHYMERLAANSLDGDPEVGEIIRTFLESDTGDDFVMVNVIDFHDTPLQVEGVEAGESSEEVAGKYMEFMIPELFARASHPVFMGRAAADAPEMFGVEGLREWHQGLGMRYRSRRDLMEIATNPEFQGSHEFKIAAIDKTIAFPVDPWFQLGDPRLLLALVFLIIGLSVSWWNAHARQA